MSSSGGSFGSAVPSGPAGGDLAGAYPGPSVAKIQGRGVSANAPGDTQALVWNAGLGLWVPMSLAIPAASATVTGPDAFGAAASPGAAAAFSRGDHDHGLPANPSAPFAVPAIVLGTAAAGGASGSKIRADATIVAFDATAPVAQAFGDAAAVGAAAVAARRDHKHGMPATPVTSLNGGTGAIAQANGYGISGANANPPVPAVALTEQVAVLGANINLAALTPTNVVSLALVAGDWWLYGQVQIADATAESRNFGIWLGPTSASITGAYAESDLSLGNLAGNTEGTTLMVAKKIHLAANTTVFLIAETGNTTTAVISSASVFTAAPTTFLEAIRIG